MLNTNIIYSTLIFAILSLPNQVFSKQYATPQPTHSPFEINSEDTSSIQNIITAYYDCISGSIGEQRDFDRLKSLFHPEARLIYSHWDDAIDKASLMIFDIDQFIDKLGYLDKKGFYEHEISNKIHNFGAVIQVFSTYEFRVEDKSIPNGRGITSYELFFDGNRYWIMSMFWNAENEKYKIPMEYLENK